MERRKFEDTFKDAFQGAEAEPSDNVWTNLELDLEKEESGRMKRRLLFYQMVAAASIAFAMLMAGVGYYALSNRDANDAPERVASADTHMMQSRGTIARGGNQATGAATETIENGNAVEGNNTEGASLFNQYSSYEPMSAEQQNAAHVQYTDRPGASHQTIAPTDDIVADNAINRTGNGLLGNKKASSSEVLLSERDNSSSSRIASATEPTVKALHGAGASGASTPVHEHHALGSASRRPLAAESNPNGNANTTNAAGIDVGATVASRSNATGSAVAGSVLSTPYTRTPGNVNGLNSADVSGTPAIANRYSPPASVTPRGPMTGMDAASLRKRDVLDDQVSPGEHNPPSGNSGKGVMLASDMSATSAGGSHTRNATAPGSWMSGEMLMSPETSNVASANHIAVNSSPVHAGGADEISAGQSIAYTGQPLPALIPAREVKLAMAQEQPPQDPVALMFARLEQRERELREGEGKKKKNKKNKDEETDADDQSERLWTSAGFAAGSFTNMNSGVTATGSNAGISSNSDLASQQVNAAGTSYSVGVGMGTKVSKRWIVQGGLNYQTQLYDYTSDKAVGDFNALQALSVSTLDKANTNNGFDARAGDQVVSTAPYTVKNDSRFVSFPVQAGYLIVNKRTGVQLNGGVSTDLFLQNTNGSSGGSLGSTTERLGDNTTYRSVNFSGLLGTEVSYKLGQRYRLALSPGVRYAFNSIFKSSTGVQAMPLTFDVGLRFRYIFH